MGWRIVEITSEDHLKLYLNNLIIRRLDKKILINISDIDILLLDNYKINISVQLINQLVRNNAIIITFDSQHEPTSYIFNVNGNHASLKVFNEQLGWKNIYKGNIWRDIVKNKIYNQMNNLKNQEISFNEQNFLKLIEEVREFDVTNREGHAAKIYWHSLFGESFTRDHDGKKDTIINSMLNYGYAVLRALVIKSIIKRGLDCRISLFHKSYTNFFALSSDLMEAFRPIVDQVIYKFRNTEIFSYLIKDEIILSLTSKVLVNSKFQYINNAIDMCVDNIISNKGWLWVDIWK